MFGWKFQAAVRIFEEIWVAVLSRGVDISCLGGSFRPQAIEHVPLGTLCARIVSTNLG